ncbi:MAG TPA: tRNA uridine-5-carboxymethylaminomethyl(34) synthesis GTPase MnmE [Flavobacteriaceae bacterium]|nr:tRNA uridine-5-carboxymethylaminomethyl(34) synthesis GTPase MnmE [Flavobacteriaceae bacterium]
MISTDTIVALATSPGKSAIAVIRVSGEDSIRLVDSIFVAKSKKNLLETESHRLVFGEIFRNETLIDEVLVSVFKGTKSYTGENSVEISCHGSGFIQGEILQLLIEKGARLANPGEFTQRAFLNGKMDLSQAEAVADLIAADSEAAKQTALKQLRGGFSHDLKQLREKLINFAALIELELDFSEEDVEFADRSEFRNLIHNLKQETQELLDSFQLGNAIKNGVRVAIIGAPNAGKSTLLNALLNEERAIVSDIAGTTRDTIEESLNINGVLFRLIDTAGIREHSSDKIENLGIQRSKDNAEKADVILHLIDVSQEIQEEFDWLKKWSEKTIVVYNKTDLASHHSPLTAHHSGFVSISAKEKTGIDELKQLMFDQAIGESISTENTIVTNARHKEALQKTMESLTIIEEGMECNLSGDLLAVDIRQALNHLASITGQVEVDRDILGTIFGKFCIGK